MHPRTKKLLSYYRPYRTILLADLGCALVVAVVTLSLPLGARVITKELVDSRAPDTLARIAAVGALMLAGIALHALCNLYVDHRGHLMGAQMERDIRAELFDHLLRLPPGFHDDQRVGQLMNRIAYDSFWLAELFHHGPEDLVLTVLRLGGTFAILITIDVPLTLVVFLSLPLMTAYAFHLNRRMNVALRTSKDRIGDINAQVEDTLSGIAVVQSFANEPVERAKFAHANERFVASRGEGYRAEALLSNGLIAFTQAVTSAVIVVGGARVVGGSLDLADLITYLLYVGLLVEPIRTALNFARLYQEGITGFDRILEVLEVPVTLRDGPRALEPSAVGGAVEFRDVGFGYRDGSERILSGVSLRIEEGEYVAFVGPSGVGKTTLCALIPRLYDVTEGAVLLGGVDVRELSLSALRSRVGVVQQDVYLFAGTVAENIGYGRAGATRAQIVEAARRANAHDFITKLPGGYDSDIGQRGVKLSGGQKQRLSVARVFLKDPPVLVFDEATSALDSESERAVQASLEALAAGRTTLVIAHRLSTIRRAHRIVVLGDDGIVEQGSHEQLMAAGGSYARLQRMQAPG